MFLKNPQRVPWKSAYTFSPKSLNYRGSSRRALERVTGSWSACCLGDTDDGRGRHRHEFSCLHCPEPGSCRSQQQPVLGSPLRAQRRGSTTRVCVCWHVTKTASVWCIAWWIYQAGYRVPSRALGKPQIIVIFLVARPLRPYPPPPIELSVHTFWSEFFKRFFWKSFKKSSFFIFPTTKALNPKHTPLLP